LQQFRQLQDVVLEAAQSLFGCPNTPDAQGAAIDDAAEPIG
jgi:hypothetical protein